MAAKRPSQQPRARAAAVALPRGRGSSRTAHGVRARLAPSRRSVLAGVALLFLAGGVYLAARETSIFAVRTIAVDGAPAPIQAQVQRVLDPFVGTNLIGLDGAALMRRVEALPTVVSATYDRSFPNTLRITVVPERPVAVLRRGKSSWLVSARGRVVTRVPGGADAALPRIWAPTALQVEAGAFLPPERGGVAAQALAVAVRFPGHVRTATFAHGTLVFRLRSGLELRLGDPTDLRLKLAVARRALALLPGGETYLDVSLPGRPVAGADSQVSGRG